MARIHPAQPNGKKEILPNRFLSGILQLCSQCGKCYFVCPHAAIRVKVYNREFLADAPSFFKHTDPIGKEFFKDKEAYTLQVAVEDCTGCKLCTEVCPIESKTQPGHKAIDMHGCITIERN